MTVSTLRDPELRDALARLERAFERGDLLTLFGRCTVEYEGRAESSLGPGERLVILKPDGAALVHTDEGRTPVNWQPPGCEHRASVRDDRLRVVSTRTNPDERLEVAFRRVDQLSSYAVTDRHELDLQGSEADLRERILDEPTLVERGFEPLAVERATDAGAIDVYGEDAGGTPVVVELKRRRVGPDAASQLRRYVDAVRRELGDGPVRGVLVAPSITDRTADLLDREGLEFVGLDPANGRPTETIDERERGETDETDPADDEGDGSDGTDGGTGGERGGSADLRSEVGGGCGRSSRPSDLDHWTTGPSAANATRGRHRGGRGRGGRVGRGWRRALIERSPPVRRSVLPFSAVGSTDGRLRDRSTRGDRQPAGRRFEAFIRGVDVQQHK